MKQAIRKNIYIVLGCLFVLLGAIGVVIPVLPTTPFLLLALALFANSSPRFHQMLLNNRWFGTTLRQWDNSKTVSRQIKKRALSLILISFSISIFFVQGSIGLQLMLATIALMLMVFVWRLNEP